MKNVKYTKIIKRVEALFLAVFLAFWGAVSPALSARSYAAEAQAALTAWEVLQLLLMSAGVTVQTASGTGSAELTDEDSYLAVMSYMRKNMEADYSGVADAIDSAITSALAKGTSSAALTVEFAEETWNGLRDWISDMAQEGREFMVGSGSGETVLLSSFTEYLDFIGVDHSANLLSQLDSFASGYISAGYGYLTGITYYGTGALSYLVFTKDENITFDNHIQSPDCCYISFSINSAGSGVYSYLSSYGHKSQCSLDIVNYSSYVISPLYNVYSDASSESLGLISDVFYAELKDKVYDVVTPHRVLTDEGAITGNMTLTIPKALAVPDAIAAVKEGTLPITDVLTQVGVIPVDMTKKKAIADDKTIDEALEAVESTSDSWSFTADLTEIFPFCLPFDLIRFLDALDADPVAPCFEIPFVVEALGIDMTVEFDMSFMDDAVEIFRIGELGCFIISLILVTQKLIKW